MPDPFFTFVSGDGPLVAAAIHEGHQVRPEVARHLALSKEERRREEDPFTAAWTTIAPHRIVVHRSRFEVDVNRPRDQAIYLRPEQAWGMRVWKSPPPPELVEQSLRDYDAFYEATHDLLSEIRAEYGRFLVLDLHSYNHRREGPDAPPAPAEENPQINVGTGTMDRLRWRPVIERFVADLRACGFDVRENVRFRGGYFPRWVHEVFPESGCALAVEVKKFFIDEWTGQPDAGQMERVREALASTVPGILDALATCPATSRR